MDWKQHHRLMRMESPLGEDKLLLTSLEGEEQVSSLFHFQLGLLSEESAIDPNALLGKSVSFGVALEDPSERRWFSGIVKRFATGGLVPRMVEPTVYSYWAEVVPEFWLSTLHRDCRVFQDMSVDKIIDEVFSDAEFVNYEWRIQKSYPKLEYCVQFDESDFSFVSRLMERFGLFYFHRHEENLHTLVISDHAGAYEDALQWDVKFRPQQVARGGGIVAPIGGAFVTDLTPSYEFKSGKWAQRDYNFLTSQNDLERTTNTVLKNADFKKYEVFEYPGGYQTSDEGSAATKLKMETEEASHKTARGMSGCASFMPGHKFKYSNTINVADAEDGQEYVVSRVVHQGRDPTFVTTEERASYSNEFEAIPSATVMRPELKTPIPRPNGPQSAVVVGPSGEEIDVDEHGRVHVQFHWDRVGEDNEKSSCWLRVAQMWAGKNWGTVFTPRVGMEVIVSFLDGDYDRPLVTGCVYNDENKPPYSLPANKTQSGIKTRSSKSGAEADFNELRFEDKAGEEEVYFHAQKDFMRKVENDDTLEVDNDQSITVTNNRTLEVSKGNEDITIAQGNRTTTISKGNETLSVKMGDISVKADAGKITVQAMQSIELKVGSNSIKIDQSGIKIKGMMVTVQGDMKADLKSPMTTVEGSGMLTVKGGIVMIN